MSKFDLTMLPPWEQLFKRVLWAQLGDLRGKRILDFGSGIGVTACHYAAENEVVAMEPSAESVAKRWDEHMGRYEAFAEDMMGQGFVVAGFGLRGHGKNAGNDQIASCLVVYAFGGSGITATAELC